MTPAWAGTYLQPDPLGIAAGSNLYGYAGGNPVTYADPDGRNMVLLAFGGAALGAAVDLSLQLGANGGQLACVDWNRTAGAAVLGALAGPSFRAIVALLSRQTTRQFLADESGAMPAQRPTRGAPDFVVTPAGEAIPIPQGANGPNMTRAPGMQFTGGSGGRGMNSRVTGVRVMEGNRNQGPRVVYENSSG